jgi:nucleoside-diphosphate-sugar epimerase
VTTHASARAGVGAGRSALDAWYAGVPVLVLGATGFIGRWVVRVLAQHGADIAVAARDTNRARDFLRADRISGRVWGVDLSQRSAATALVRDTRPAVVFNLAGYGVDRAERDPDVMATVNTSVVEELCEQLAEEYGGWAGLRLVHAGSALEYGEISGSLREDAAPNPTTDYGRTKLEATRAIERAAVTSRLRAVTARLFTVYGPGEHPGRLLPSLIETARTRVRLPLSAGDQRRDFTYVEDVAEGLLRLGVTPAVAGAVVNVATGRLTSVREFVETAARVLPIDRTALAFGELPIRTEEMWHGDVDVSRLRELTSWVPSTSIAEGIRRSWEWDNASA